jgi:hypothetical protein
MLLETGLQRFVRGLLGGATAQRRGSSYILADGRRAAAADVAILIHSGAIAGSEIECRANAETTGWLKRVRLDADAFAAQHRVSEARPDGTAVNLAESPLARLAAGDAAFLERHHVEAGERIRRMVERAQLQRRLTMAYSASRTAGNRQQAATDISDLAADSRKALAEIHRLLPRDCAGVVLDVCGLLKGLQEVERDRGWPRRSAKLVLRIGLEQLAQHYGLGPFAVGPSSRKPRIWQDEGARPDKFG